MTGNGFYRLFVVMTGGWFMALFSPHAPSDSTPASNLRCGPPAVAGRAPQVVPEAPVAQLRGPAGLGRLGRLGPGPMEVQGEVQSERHGNNEKMVVDDRCFIEENNDCSDVMSIHPITKIGS